MKAVLIVFAVFGAGWVAAYYLGGYGNFDPSAQGRQARAAITPGMTWEQVFDLTSDPKRYQIINRKVERRGAEEVVYFKRSSPVKFERERLVGHMANNTLPDGFACTFNYSNSVAFSVVFDGTGTVMGVEDATTMADWLQYKD